MRMRPLRILSLLAGMTTFVLATSSPVSLEAQTPFVPYFGKNRVRYDNFKWQIYQTPLQWIEREMSTRTYVCTTEHDREAGADSSTPR